MKPRLGINMSSESEDGSSSEAGYEDESGFVVEAEKHVVSTTENNQNDVDMTKPSSSTGSNARDPLRQRRRKARRACYACQRAHLTCGMYTVTTRSGSRP